MLHTKEPALVIADRAGIVEKTHLADVYACDSRDKILLSMGDSESRVYPRSAIKLLQAMDAVESGVADKFGLSESELALACSSHWGEIAHIATAQSMLAKAGLKPELLLCGSEIPRNAESRKILIKNDRLPSALHHNCSGKHSLGLCWSHYHGATLNDYTDPHHPLQKTIRHHLERFTGDSFDHPAGIDGCSFPTWARPLSHWSRAMAKIADPSSLGEKTERAVAILLSAVRKNPMIVAGEGTFVSHFTRAFGQRIYIKNGADGVMCAAIPEQRIGIAIKVRNGNKRAASLVLIAVLQRLGILSANEAERWRIFKRTNAAGLHVGMIHVEL